MTPVRTILALDLATSTGWALLDGLGAVTSGTQRFDLGRGESPGMRFVRFRRWLTELVHVGPAAGNKVARSPAVDVIAFERAHHRGGAATEVCVGFMTAAQEIAAAHGIELAPVHTMTLKKHATGSGKAKKPDMIAAATKRWGWVPATDDEAEALCILAWAIDECGVKPAESAT